MLPNLLENTWSVAAIVVGNLAAVCLTTPIFIVPLLVIVVALYLVQRWYKGAAIAVQRLESTSRSPVFSHFTETLHGSATIRAFRAQDRFAEENITKNNTNIMNFWLTRAIFRWAVLRIEILNSFRCCCLLFVRLVRSVDS